MSSRGIFGIGKRGTIEDVLDISKESIVWIPRLIILVVVTFAILYIINLYSANVLDTHGVEELILMKRLTYSRECFAYSDESRTYPGIIDLNKFSNEIAVKCVEILNNEQKFRARLEDDKGELVKEISNSEKLDELGLCGIEKKPFRCKSDKGFVLYYDKDELKKGVLNFEIITYENV